MPSERAHVLSNRTGIDFKVKLPFANNLVSLTHAPITLHCADEFINFIMIAMDPQ